MQFTFKKTSPKKWQGVGFGYMPASHELYVDGQPTGITISGNKNSDFCVRSNGAFITLSSTFAFAKEAAIATLTPAS